MSKFETRIQKKNHLAIMLAGLKIFSQFGFRGSTLDQIAAESGMSKPNILYYFQSKDAIYEALLAQLLTDWLKPVRDINPDGDPIEELLTYAKHKIMMSRLYPRESRLYANEIIQGAPRIGGVLKGGIARSCNHIGRDYKCVVGCWVDTCRQCASSHLFDLGNDTTLRRF